VKIRTPSQLDFQLDLKFFGFDTKYQIQLHEQLFDLIWYGDGRWDWNTVYHLPLHIKRLWIKQTNKKLNPKEVSEQTAAEAKAKQPLYNVKKSK